MRSFYGTFNGATPEHDLHNFIRQLSDEMASEYKRIRNRTKEDPGTAGDQGEENWADLLRDWLPIDLTVVTKGRMISHDGRMSPQIDILVLSGSYPRKLHSKKIYLAGGVVAAFECKTTLRSAHIGESVSNCQIIKSMFDPRQGTPYRELHSPIIYGLLAHSHQWSRKTSSPEANIVRALEIADREHAQHPRLQLDILCVADLATWSASKVAFLGPSQVGDWTEFRNIYGESGSAVTSFMGHQKDSQSQISYFNPIGAFISTLSNKLAWENAYIRNIADYYRRINIKGDGQGTMRHWPSTIYSDEIRRRVEMGHLSNGSHWDEWSLGFV